MRLYSALWEINGLNTVILLEVHTCWNSIDDEFPDAVEIKKEGIKYLVAFSVITWNFLAFKV